MFKPIKEIGQRVKGTEMMSDKQRLVGKEGNVIAIADYLPRNATILFDGESEPIELALWRIEAI